MANIVITTIGNDGVYVDFGVYASSELLSPQGYQGKTIISVSPTADTNGIHVLTQGRDAQKWPVCHTATAGYMIVDSIDGVTPTGWSDLISKLTALM